MIESNEKSDGKQKTKGKDGNGNFFLIIIKI